MAKERENKRRGLTSEREKKVDEKSVAEVRQ
jgi:hypothetical protein